MATVTSPIFRLDEAAVAYALSAERILGKDRSFLSENSAVIPIFVSHLFQSLEISIKHMGIEAGLFAEHEARDRSKRSGHGIAEISSLAAQRLRSTTIAPLIMALTFNTVADAQNVIHKMICGAEFEKTRNAYANRQLGYAQVADGDFALLSDLQAWVEVIKATALNLGNCVAVVKQWKQSQGTCNSFAIWIKGQ